MNKIQNLKETYRNLNDDIILNKTGNNYSDDTYNIIKTNNTFNTTDDQYFTKKYIVQVLSATILHDITITIMNII